MKQRGKLIVIEGTDGSGKGTQSRILVKRLTDMGKKAVLISYPRYESFTGAIVGDYLNGKFGSLEQVHPKLASLAFALDRFANASVVENYLAAGVTVICDRYVESNIIYQCAKLPSEQRAEFRDWLRAIEYSILGLQEPDTIVFLDVPPNVSSKLVLQKDARTYTDKKEDIHEANHAFMASVYEVFKSMLDQPNWERVDCINSSGDLHTVPSISDNLMEILGYKDASVTPKIFIDMDGPLVDFERFVKEKCSSGERVKTMVGAYKEMEPTPQGIESVRSLIGMGFDVWLATKPPTGVPHAYSDKVEWVLKYLPQLKRKIILTHDKGLLGSEYDYLIDDRPHKANCEAFPGVLIDFTPGRWTWDSIMEYFRCMEQNKR